MYECIKTLIHSFFTAQGFCIDGPRLEMDCSNSSPRTHSAYIPCTCFDFPVVRHRRSPLRLMRSCARLFPQVPALCCALLAGCSGEESVTEWTAIEITPEMRIDGHEAVLSNISHLAVSTHGRMAVAESPGEPLRFFGPGGKPLDVVFRRGEGPGEFQAVNRVGWVADTLWVFDFRLNRVTLISPELSVGRTFGTPTSARLRDEDVRRIPEFARARPEALYLDGSTLSRLSGPTGDGSEDFPEGMTTLGLVSREGTLQEIVARIPAGPSSFTWRSGDMAAGAQAPFPMNPIFSVSPDGTRTVVVETSVAGPDLATVHVVALSPTSDTIFARDYSIPTPSIPSHVADSAVEAFAKAMEQGIPAAARAFRNQAWVPPNLPPGDRCFGCPGWGHLAQDAGNGGRATLLPSGSGWWTCRPGAGSEQC